MKTEFLGDTCPKNFKSEYATKPNVSQVPSCKFSPTVFRDALNGPIFKLNRIWELDFLRGFCIILMIFDHFFFLGSHVFGYSLSSTVSGREFVEFCYYYWYEFPRDSIHILVLFFFFSLCGISCYLSHSNYKRGLLLAIVASIYSTLSYIVDSELGMGILTNYGVLNFLATCIMVYAVVELILKKNKIALSIFSFCAFLITWSLFCFYTPPKDLPLFLSWIFPSRGFDGLNPLLYKCESIFSQRQVSPSDFFPFIPYAAFFFCGTIMGYSLYGKKTSLIPSLNGNWTKPFRFFGRHALIVYLVHIVILSLILELITIMATGEPCLFNF